MYYDPFFADLIQFVFILLIILTTVVLAVGILRFYQLYTHQANHNPLALLPNEINKHHSDLSLDKTDSKSVALDYIKRNFIAGSENNNNQTL